MSHVKGKLKLKGNFAKIQQKREQKVRDRLDDQEEREKEKIFTQAFSSSQSNKKGPYLLQFKAEEAQGTIMTSGRTVHGQGTKFLTDIEKNDFIIITSEKTNEEEEKKVIAVLSDKSCMIESPFEVDLQTFIGYKIRKQDREQEAEETLEEQYRKQFLNASKKIKKDDKVTLEYREKKGMWSYKTLKEEVDSKDVTKEKLLNMRSKKNRDKFCWI